MKIEIIILIVCVALCIIMFIYLKWYIKQRTSENGVLKETNIKVKKWINEVNLSIAEINAVTDRNLLLIEDKIKNLQRILEDTDKRISVYIKEVEKSKTSEALYTQLGRGVRAAISEPASQPAQLSLVRPNLVVSQSALQPEKPVQPMLPLDEPEKTPANVKPSEKEQIDSKKPLSKKQIRFSIDQLANEGLQPQEIASRLGISIAEVDLAMQLRRK